MSDPNKVHRICPVPYKWKDYWELIGSPRDLQPLILGGWSFSTDRQKRQRFLDQVDYAERSGRGERAEHFLAVLGERDWHTCAEEHLDFDYGASLAAEARHMEWREEEAEKEVEKARALCSELISVSDREAFRPENLESLVSEYWLRFWLYDGEITQRICQIEEHLSRDASWSSQNTPSDNFIEEQLTGFRTAMQMEKILLGLHLSCSEYNRLTDSRGDFWREVFQ